MAAYKDGIANGVGLIFAIGFMLYFIRREDVGGSTIGLVMILLCVMSIWLVTTKYRLVDRRVQEMRDELEKEGEK